MTLKASYILGLCEAAQQSSVGFGPATRLSTQSLTFNIDAAKVIHSIVKFSPAAESVALEFLNKFQEVSRLRHLVASVLSGEVDANQWAQDMLMAVRDLDQEQLSLELEPVLDLASEYLTHLLIAVRNPGGIKTPQESQCPTPKVLKSSACVTALVDDAVIIRNQAALKTLVYARDSCICAFTDLSFDPQDDSVRPRCAHILPFSLGDKPASLRMIEAFTGNQLSAGAIRENINHPRNAFNVERNAHDRFEQLNWGIEATHANGQTIYRYRKVASSSPTIRRRDGDEIFFNGGLNGNMVDGPNPEFCNLKLAIARALHACGAANIIAEIYDNDGDEFFMQPSYFGGPFVSDEALCRRLDDRLAPYV